MRPTFIRAHTWFVLFVAAVSIGWGVTLTSHASRQKENILAGAQAAVRGLPTVAQLPPPCSPILTPTVCSTCKKMEDATIPVMDRIESTITVLGLGPYLTDLVLTTNIEHGSSADLNITLTKKGALGQKDVVVTVTDRNGAPNAKDLFADTMWLNKANPEGQVPYTPNERFNNGLVTDHNYGSGGKVEQLTPQESFGAFIGENPNGDWVLTITNDNPTIDGKLIGWSLAIASLSDKPIEQSKTFFPDPKKTPKLPISIPTGPGVVRSMINVSGMGKQIGNLALNTSIRHTFNADLDITLTKMRNPNNPGDKDVVVTITTDNGGSNDDVFNGTRWHDKANQIAEKPSPTDGLVTRHAFKNGELAKDLVPEEPLAAFNGIDPNGDWMLTIYDDNAGDGGTLINWSLEITTITCPRANLAITKTDGTTTYTPGGTTTYMIVASNPGPSNVTGATVTDTFPAAITSANWTCAATGGATCSTNGSGNINTQVNLPVSSAVTFTVTANISASASGDLSNTATVAAPPGVIDPNSANNSATDTDTPMPKADLGLTKVASNANPVAGGLPFSYTLTVTNKGPSNAVAAIVTDTLPENIVIANSSIAITPADSGFSCPPLSIGSKGTVTCTNPNFAAGASATFTIVVQAEAGSASGVRTNTAAVTSGTTEVSPDPTPNTASAVVNITNNASLSISKTASATACSGDPFTYHIVVNNSGTNAALGATISDPLPANTTVLLPLNGTGAFATGCSHNGGTPGIVTCAAVDIPPGQSTLDITVKLSPSAPSGPLSNTATITNAGTGTIVVGTSTTTATVNHCADLFVEKQAVPVIDPDGAGPLPPVALPVAGPNVPPGSVNAGGYIRYNLPFGNKGPSDAINVLITDPMPGNMAFVGALATGDAFVPSAQPPSNPFTFTITAIDMVAPLGPTINLTCMVTSAAGNQSVYCRPQGNTSMVPPYADGVLPAGYNGQVTFFLRVNESVAGGTIVNNSANILSGQCPNLIGGGVSPFPPVPCASTDDPNSSNNISLPTSTLVVAPTSLTALAVFANVNSAGNIHTLLPNATQPNVVFVNNLPQGSTLSEALDSLLPLGFSPAQIQGVTLAGVAGPGGASAQLRLEAVVNVLRAAGGPPTPRARTTGLSSKDIETLKGNLVGVSEVIFFELN